MKQQIINFIFFLSFLFILSSCHALVDDEFPNYEPQAVLNGLLRADSTFRVQVSLTANLQDSVPIYVSNAIVIIESSVDTPDTLLYTQEGWYVSDRTVKAGASYTCSAQIPGYATLSAETTIPTPTEIDSIVYIDLAGRNDEGTKISSVEFRIPNDTGKKQFWEVKLITESMEKDYNFGTDDYTEYFAVRDKYIYMLAGQDSVLLSEANPLTVFSNKKMRTNAYTVKFYLQANYSSYGNSSGTYTEYYHFSDNETPYILLFSMDESYYKYLKQYEIYLTSTWSNIGKSSQNYPLYSNVKNGRGIFTGMSVTRAELIINTEEE